MHVIVNCTKHIEIEDPDIIVKDKRLYNKRFDCYEGVDGDYVSFDVKLDNGSIMTIGGTVDGYTVFKRQTVLIDGTFCVL